MILFISGEISPGIEQAFIDAATKIAATVNAAIAGNNYGISLEKWYCLPIILQEAVAGLDEGWLYNEAQKYVEFRIPISFASFASSSPLRQRELLFKNLLTSIAVASTMEIPDFDCERFVGDARRIGTAAGWVSVSPEPRARSVQ